MEECWFVKLVKTALNKVKKDKEEKVSGRVKKLLQCGMYPGLSSDVILEAPCFQLDNEDMEVQRHVFLAVTNTEFVMATQTLPDYPKLSRWMCRTVVDLDLEGMELIRSSPLDFVRFYVIDTRTRQFAVWTSLGSFMSFEMCNTTDHSGELWTKWQKMIAKREGQQRNGYKMGKVSRATFGGKSTSLSNERGKIIHDWKCMNRSFNLCGADDSASGQVTENDANFVRRSQSDCVLGMSYFFSHLTSVHFKFSMLSFISEALPNESHRAVDIVDIRFPRRGVSRIVLKQLHKLWKHRNKERLQQERKRHLELSESDESITDVFQEMSKSVKQRSVEDRWKSDVALTAKRKPLTQDELTKSVVFQTCHANKHKEKLWLYGATPEDMAVQLTQIHTDMFKRVTELDIINYFDKHNQTRPSGLHDMLSFSRGVSLLVAMEILKTKEPSQLAQRIRFFIQVLQVCRESRDLQSTFAVQSGLRLLSVARKKVSWSDIASKYPDLMRIFNDVSEIFSHLSSYKYKAELWKSSQCRPFLPWLNHFLWHMKAIFQKPLDDSDRRNSNVFNAQHIGNVYKVQDIGNVYKEEHVGNVYKIKDIYSLQDHRIQVQRRVQRIQDLDNTETQKQHIGKLYNIKHKGNVQKGEQIGRIYKVQDVDCVHMQHHFGNVYEVQRTDHKSRQVQKKQTIESAPDTSTKNKQKLMQEFIKTVHGESANDFCMDVMKRKDISKSEMRSKYPRTPLVSSVIVNMALSMSSEIIREALAEYFNLRSKLGTDISRSTHHGLEPVTVDHRQSNVQIDDIGEVKKYQPALEERISPHSLRYLHNEENRSRRTSLSEMAVEEEEQLGLEETMNHEHMKQTYGGGKRRLEEEEEEEKKEKHSLGYFHQKEDGSRRKSLFELAGEDEEQMRLKETMIDYAVQEKMKQTYEGGKRRSIFQVWQEEEEQEEEQAVEGTSVPVKPTSFLPLFSNTGTSVSKKPCIFSSLISGIKFSICPTEDTVSQRQKVAHVVDKNTNWSGTSLKITSESRRLRSPGKGNRNWWSSSDQASTSNRCSVCEKTGCILFGSGLEKLTDLQLACLCYHMKKKTKLNDFITQRCHDLSKTVFRYRNCEQKLRASYST